MAKGVWMVGRFSRQIRRQVLATSGHSTPGEVGVDKNRGCWKLFQELV